MLLLGAKSDPHELKQSRACVCYMERNHIYLSALLQALKVELVSLLASGYRETGQVHVLWILEELLGR